MAIAPFQPQYIQPSELELYGLPTETEQADIMSLVRLASVLIDRNCGRLDGDGTGSLVYTTYDETLLLANDNRNLIYLAQKPLVALSTDTVANLQDLATDAPVNYTYTGVQPYSYVGPDNQPSAILNGWGRYGYIREDRSVGYPDLYAQINPLNLVTMFGGPAPFTSIDITNTSYNPRSGEVWVPAGIMLQRYSEIRLMYTAGFNPLNMPVGIPKACAMIVKGALARGNATSGLLSMTLGRAGANVTFSPGLIDETVDSLLQPYKSIIGR